MGNDNSQMDPLPENTDNNLKNPEITIDCSQNSFKIQQFFEKLIQLYTYIIKEIIWKKQEEIKQHYKKSSEILIYSLCLLSHS